MTDAERRGTKLGIGERRAVVIGVGALAWLVGLLWIFPFAWTVLTSFKTEDDAAAQTLHQGLSFGRYSDVGQSTQGTLSLQSAFTNSLVVVLVSTTIVMLLALPAAYALAIRPIHKWRDVLFFFISTKMLPVAGAIIPLYVIARSLHLLDTLPVLIILYTSLNLPIAVWMLRSFLLEVPVAILEAAHVDGASFFRQLRSVVLPLITPGMAATALICFIFAWNEFFLAVNLTTTNAATVPVYLVGFQSGEGQFWAHLCAGATLACLPVLIAGWAAQDKLVRGLTMGAVK